MKNLSIHKKIFLILFIVWLIITSNIIKSTYAKYISTIHTGANVAFSRWNILLNDKNILDSDEMQNALTLTFPGNEYMLEDVIVPGAVGYFDLNIDSSNTTVPFEIIVNSTIDQDSAYTDEFAVSGYSINNMDDFLELPTDQTTFSHKITPDINETQIRVYLSWIDDGVADAEDTELGVAAEAAMINVNLRFQQTVGEAIPDLPTTTN